MSAAASGSDHGLAERRFGGCETILNPANGAPAGQIVLRRGVVVHAFLEGSRRQDRGVGRFGGRQGRVDGLEQRAAQVLRGGRMHQHHGERWQRKG